MIKKPELLGEVGCYVYLVRAQNNALYCGISRQPAERLIQHKTGKGARFFATSPACSMVYLEWCASRSEALKREYAIKKKNKTDKEAMILQFHQQSSECKSSLHLKLQKINNYHLSH